MAGSYSHAIADDGQLLNSEGWSWMVENLGDAYETVEEMYGMIWWLARGDARLVADAQREYRVGLERSPGTGGKLRGLA